jgi:hypothetical protein
MSATQVAEIHPAIREVFDAAAGGEDWCATFEVSTDPTLWIQVTSNSLNMAYPYEEPPNVLLLQVGTTQPNHFTILDWSPRISATFGYSEKPSTSELAQLVDKLFVLTLKCAPDYSLNVALFLM